MKKILAMMFALVLVLGVTASAENGEGMKGWALVSGYAGYTFGMGDAFADEEETILGVTYKASFDAGLCFGGAFHYGVAPMFLVGGELGFQSYKAEASAGGITVSDTETKMNILASGMYALNYVENEQAFFIVFGVGSYGGWDEFGFNAGVLYSKMLTEKLPFFVMPRIHYVMADPDAAMMVQVIVGITFPVAGYEGK